MRAGDFLAVSALFRDEPVSGYVICDKNNKQANHKLKTQALLICSDPTVCDHRDAEAALDCSDGVPVTKTSHLPQCIGAPLLSELTSSQGPFRFSFGLRELRSASLEQSAGPLHLFGPVVDAWIAVFLGVCLPACS